MQDSGTTPEDAGSTSPDAGTVDAGTVLVQGEVRHRKPNLMLLVDTSGSMVSPIDPTDPDCTVNGERCGGATPCDTTRCPTRWSTLQAAMNSFLSQYGTVARLGLGTYPSDDFCGPSTRLRAALPFTEDDATLQAKASEVNAALQSIRNHDPVEHNMPQGGTPTGSSLGYMASRPELQGTERADFVLLLTDGLPNCNESYPNPYPSSACRCTLAPSDCSFVPKVGCMDDVGSIAAVRELRSKDIRTIVMGFGSDTGASAALAMFNTLAEEGGFTRKCQQNSECGAGDTCDPVAGACGRRFYQAGNQAELAAALQAASQKAASEAAKDSCLIRFGDSSGSYTQESLQVSLDGQVLAAGPDSWSLTSEGLRFTGSACQKIAASTPTAPVRIEVRVFP